MCAGATVRRSTFLLSVVLAPTDWPAVRATGTRVSAPVLVILAAAACAQVHEDFRLSGVSLLALARRPPPPRDQPAPLALAFRGQFVSDCLPSTPVQVLNQPLCKLLAERDSNRRLPEDAPKPKGSVTMLMCARRALTDYHQRRRLTLGRWDNMPFWGVEVKQDAMACAKLVCQVSSQPGVCDCLYFIRTIRTRRVSVTGS